MADYIIGGILVALAILAMRSVFKKTSSGGCAGCSGCNGCGPSCHGQDQETASKSAVEWQTPAASKPCRLLTNHFKKHII